MKFLALCAISLLNMLGITSKSEGTKFIVQTRPLKILFDSNFIICLTTTIKILQKSFIFLETSGRDKPQKNLAKKLSAQRIMDVKTYIYSRFRILSRSSFQQKKKAIPYNSLLLF